MRNPDIARCGWLAILLLLAGTAWAQAHLEVNTPAIAALQKACLSTALRLMPRRTRAAQPCCSQQRTTTQSSCSFCSARERIQKTATTKVSLKTKM